MSTLSFSHSLSYLCEKAKQPMSMEAKKELYDVVEVAAKNSKPTIRQLFNALISVRMASHGPEVSALDISYQMGLLISLSKLPYMIPDGPLLNQEKMLNSIVRMLKDEIHEKDTAPFELNLDAYKYADPWKLSLCALYLAKIVTNSDKESAEYSNIAFKNIHNLYLAASKISETDHGWCITVLLVLLAKVDLAIFVSKMPKKSESHERSFDLILNLTLHSIFEVVERLDYDDSDLQMYLALVAIEAAQKLLSFQESIWQSLSDSRQMDWVQRISKIITKLAASFLSKSDKSDLWLLISRLFLILMTADGFKILLVLPDTTISLLQLAMDRMSVASARFERQTWLPFLYKFCICILHKNPNVSLEIEKYEWIESSSDDPEERMQSLFLDIYMDNYDEWYEAICNILSTSLKMYLN